MLLSQCEDSASARKAISWIVLVILVNSKTAKPESTRNTSVLKVLCLVSGRVLEFVTEDLDWGLRDCRVFRGFIGCGFWI